MYMHMYMYLYMYIMLDRRWLFIKLNSAWTADECRNSVQRHRADPAAVKWNTDSRHKVRENSLQKIAASVYEKNRASVNALDAAWYTSWFIEIISNTFCRFSFKTIDIYSSKYKHVRIKPINRIQTNWKASTVIKCVIIYVQNTF